MDRLSHTFAALADPTRRAILARLIQGETSVTELAQPFDMSLPAVSKHLKVLEKAGLVSRSREAQWRPCRLDAGPLKDVTDWLEPYRQLWEARFGRLEAYLSELQQVEAKASEGSSSGPSVSDAGMCSERPAIETPASPASPSPPAEHDDGPYR